MPLLMYLVQNSERSDCRARVQDYRAAVHQLSDEKIYHAHSGFSDYASIISNHQRYELGECLTVRS